MALSSITYSLNTNNLLCTFTEKDIFKCLSLCQSLNMIILILEIEPDADKVTKVYNIGQILQSAVSLSATHSGHMHLKLPTYFFVYSIVLNVFNSHLRKHTLSLEICWRFDTLSRFSNFSFLTKSSKLSSVLFAIKLENIYLHFIHIYSRPSTYKHFTLSFTIKNVLKH